MAGLNFNVTSSNNVACSYVKAIEAIVDFTAPTQIVVRVGMWAVKSDSDAGSPAIGIIDADYAIPFDAVSALSFQQQIDSGLLANSSFSGATQA